MNNLFVSLGLMLCLGAYGCSSNPTTSALEKGESPASSELTLGAPKYEEPQVTSQPTPESFENDPDSTPHDPKISPVLYDGEDDRPPKLTQGGVTARENEFKGEVYPLWFATNRKPVLKDSTFSDYSNASDSSVHYGKVFVEIPEDYLKSLRNQTWLKRILIKSPETTITVRKPITITRSEMFMDIQKELQPLTTDERVALIYIHGFQTTFVEAAQRAAGIGYQLKIPITAFFSWPSKGKLAGYEADRNSVEVSDEQLARFLIDFTRESNANRVHILAHSMGNYALLRAMYRPVMQEALKKGLKFGQIILAAPDVDARVFARDSYVLANAATRVTIYASANDIALSASAKLAAFQRAGSMPPPTIISGLDTLDVSSVNLSFLGHSYIAGEIAVLEDISKILLHNDPPTRRTRLTPMKFGSSIYWVLQ